MAQQINIGDMRRVSVAFTNASNAAADPTTVKLHVRKPYSAQATTYTYNAPGSPIVKDSTGAYHADLSLDTAGTWYYEWEGTGAVEAAEEGSFFVEGRLARS